MNKTQIKIQEALLQIEEGLEHINNNQEWLNFLSFQSKFYNYSFGNTMLIYLQNPHASFVKGYKSWNALGRYVKKGEKGIAILSPCIKKVDKSNEEQEEAPNSSEETVRKLCGFRISYVYDIQSTEGSEDMLPTLVKGLKGDTSEMSTLFMTLKTQVEKKYPIIDTKGTSEKGSYNLATNIISIRSDLDTLQRFKTLIHEYAHALDFSIRPRLDDEPKNQREIVAESVAYIVCNNLGLDTKDYSFPYIKTWLNEKEELKSLATIIQKISYEILNILSNDTTTHEKEN